MKRFLAAVLVLLASASFLFSLETRRGQIRILLDEDKGTFSIYHSPRGEEEKSFFVSQDPRTTGITLLVNNRLFRMGQNSTFRQEAVLTDSGCAYVWTSPSLKAVLDFVFVSSDGSSYSDGVRLLLTLENLSRNSQNVGVRFLFDTWLGETGRYHFSLSDLSAVEGEKELSGGFPDYWTSGDSGASTRLQVMLKGKGTTPPARVIFANWKRLNETSWNYDTHSSRNFNFLPYSINDSAVAQYYDIQPLEPAASREISILLGLFSDRGFTEITPAAAALAAEPVVPVEPGNDETLLEAVRVDLTQVNKVLQQIEAALSSGEELDQATLNSLKDSVMELEERRSRYQTE